MTRSARRRVGFLLLLLITAALGLTARAIKPRYPFLGDATGDALWATFAFGVISLAWPLASQSWRALAAVAVAFAVEFSQLYHRPWIDSIRTTTLGAMILGYTFDGRDLAWYVAGVLFGGILERGAGVIRRS